MDRNVTSVYYDVYLGAWTNWSRGRILGATLTVTRINGTILIAFAAYFLTLVLGRFWGLGCMLLHWLFSTPEPRDVVHHQSQVILRNSSSPQEGLWTYIRLFWASRQTTGRVLRRTWPAWAFALFCIGSFTAATYFLPLISSASGDEVLLTGKNCGLFMWTQSNLSDAALLWTPYLAGKISNAESYARNCYSGSDGALGCEKFPVVEVPVAADTNAKCPFAPEMCRNQDSNLILDTGLLDTNDHFGMNAPTSERVLFRKVLHCAPLVTDGYTKTRQTPSRNLTQYLYGVSAVATGFVNMTSNVTNEVDDLEAQYYDERYIPVAGSANNYRLLISYSNVAGKQTQPAISTFLPIPQLLREDGDILLVLLVSAGVISSTKSDDPWYRFNVQTTNQAIKIGINATVAPTYHMGEAASPLGCVQQYQFCNSALGSDRGCGPLASANDAMDGAIGLFRTEEEQARLAWTYMMMAQGYYLSNILKQLGPQSLLSQSGLMIGRQGPMPANQWQVEVSHWFATSLAAMQAAYIDAANGATDPRLQQFALPEYEDESHTFEYKETLCKTQKMQSVAHMSFSLFGLLFIFITGAVIIILPNTLEALFAYRSKRKASRRYPYLEWTTNQTLQLHRLAHEGRGWGSWFQATDYIPVTNANEPLACLDLSDPKHPTYCDLEGANSKLATSLTPRTTSQTTEEGWDEKLGSKSAAYEKITLNESGR